MAEKTLNARVQMKADTEANWLKATNFTPKNGEIIVYAADDNCSYPRMKVGDDSKKVNERPFINEAISESTINSTCVFT